MTSLAENLQADTLKCLACRHYCHLAPGAAGICGVRTNEGGKLKLLVYGQAAGVGIDPVEKKPLFHFLPGQEIFSLGTVGCNFACRFCQNWDISQATKGFRKQVQQGKLKLRDLELTVMKLGADLPPQKIVKYCVDQDIPAIAYTYNEPAIFFEYAYDTAKLAKKKKIKNVFVSNGYSSKEALQILTSEGLLDAANIDLKSFNPEFYRGICNARLDQVLECIADYVAKKIWIEITTLVIPGKNDSEAELRQIARFIAGLGSNIPWHISRFSPMYQMLDVPETSKKSLIKAYEIGKEEGLQYIYPGNVFDSKRQSTYCPKCNTLLVERDWDYANIKNIDLHSASCKLCHAPIPGIWE